MITRRWDPAGDGRRVGQAWPGPGVGCPTTVTLLGSRPRPEASWRHVDPLRDELVALGGAKALLGSVGLSVLVDRLPEEGLERCLGIGYPAPWHWEGVGVAGEVPAPSPPSRNEPTRASGTPPLAPGALDRCCALGDPGVCNNPGVIGVAPRLGTGDGTEGPWAPAGWDAGVGQYSIARELSPTPPGRSDAQEEGVPLCLAVGVEEGEVPPQGQGGAASG
jgi:hypothetical protein